MARVEQGQLWFGSRYGKKSRTTPSPVGPAPTAWQRLDHGQFRLGRRRPWLGLLRLLLLPLLSFGLLHEQRLGGPGTTSWFSHGGRRGTQLPLGFFPASCASLSSPHTLGPS
jgi:hypothetical protein